MDGLKKDRLVKYSCRTCGSTHKGYTKDPKTQLFRETHSKRHINKCPRCTKLFLGAQELMTHMQIEHNFQKYKCSLCEFSTYQQQQIIDHFKIKHDAKGCWPCKKCDTKYHTKEELSKHVCQGQPGLCQYCGYTSQTLTSLAWHVRTYHTERPFNCNLCNKKLATETGLTLHMRAHEHPKPRRDNYVCDECGREFKLKCTLQRHMYTHSGLKPLQCSICSKSFAKRETLRQHLLTHTGRRPYSCDLCSKTFVQKPALTNHRKSHPGNHPPMPKVYIDSYIKEVDPKMVHKTDVSVPKLKTDSETFDDFRAKQKN